MKGLQLVLFCLTSNMLCAQTLQLHYDARHTLDPKHTNRNFATVYFEYFKTQDSGKAFIKPGSFLLKMQADFLGPKSNMGKFYMQVSQSFRCWQPKVFVNVQYSGGLGVTEPTQYSYYITNAYSVGVSYPFKWGSAYMSSVLNYKYVSYKKASRDFLYTLYWWKGLWNYRGEWAGDFSIWTENKNHGDDDTKDLHGKRFFFFAEPQLWYRLKGALSIGTKVNMYYHVLMPDNRLAVYPTLAIKCKL